MREITYRNLLSVTGRKKNIVLRECVDDNGVLAKTERRCFYFIKETYKLNHEENADSWITANKERVDAIGSRTYHILKKRDGGSGEDRVICKMLGTFFVIANRTVYTIAFLHSFKFSFKRLVKPQ